MQAANTELTEELGRIEGHLQADPANRRLLVRAIDLCLDLGQAGRAAQHAAAALALYPDDPIVAARHGNVLLASQQWNEAAAVFEQLLAADPNVHLAYNLAYAYLWLGRHGDAYDTLAPYAHQPDLSPAAATLLVRAMHHLGRFEEAVAFGAEHAACEADPTFAAALSVVHFDDGAIDEAVRLSELALSSPQRPLEAMVVAGSLALARTDADRAIAQFKEVLALQPREGRSWSGMGMATMLKRDFAGAASQLEEAVKHMPDHIGTWHTLGWCKIFLQDLDGAAAAFEQALALDRSFGDTHGGLAVVAALRGQREQAASSILRARRLNPISLPAKYAQMVLDGDTQDPARFQQIAYALLSTQTGLFGENMADLVKKNVQR